MSFCLRVKGVWFPTPLCFFWSWSHLDDFSFAVLELAKLKAYYNCPKTFQHEEIQKGGSLEVQMQNPTCVTWRTDTLIRFLAVGMTSSSVQAGLGHVAEVWFGVLTILSREPWSTFAGSLSYQGCSFTSSPILTGIAFTRVSVLTVISKKAFSTPATEKKLFAAHSPEAPLSWEDTRNEVPSPLQVLEFAIISGNINNPKCWRHRCNRAFLWDCPRWDHWRLKFKLWNRSLQNKYCIQLELYQMQELAFRFKTSVKAQVLKNCWVTINSLHLLTF